MDVLPNTRLLTEEDEIRRLLSPLNGKTSNCYWTPSEARKAVQSKSIYELESGNGMAWIRREPYRNQFYFRVRPDQVDSFICELPDRLDYVAEVIFFSSPSQTRMLERNILCHCGFTLTDHARMMTRESAGFQTGTLNGIRKARLNDGKEIQRIFLDSFDTLTDAIPIGTNLMACIEEGKIWVKEEEETHAVSGCVMLDTGGRRTWIRHLTVDRRLRRQGIAKKLLNFALSGGFMTENRDCRQHELALWVRESNSAAMQLYSGMWFKSSNREMEIWTKKALPEEKQNNNMAEDI